MCRTRTLDNVDKTMAPVSAHVSHLASGFDNIRTDMDGLVESLDAVHAPRKGELQRLWQQELGSESLLGDLGLTFEECVHEKLKSMSSR